MNKVTSIKKLKNNHYIVIVEENNKEQTILVTEETLLRCNVISPRDITDQEYKLLKSTKDVDLLYDKAIHFVDYQMRTISEVKKHLKKSTVDEKAINQLIDKLKSQGYLDDIRFVKEYVTQKIEFDLIGPKAIKQKLIDKGVHFDLIDAELIRFTDEMQYQKIYQLIEKETKFKIKKPYLKAIESLKRKCISKGFKLSIIDSSIASFKDKIEEACDETDLLIKEFDKLSKGVDISNYLEKDKLIQKLRQKGFAYQSIKNLF
jgi:regulatory protein